MLIRALTRADYPRVSAIYQQGIDGGDATFTSRPPSWEGWDASRSKAGRLVGVENDRVIGWACLSDVSSNCVYHGVGETSVYVDNAQQSKGVGQRLLKALVKASEAAGYWTLQALIFPENKASIDLHQMQGFEVLAVHKKLGQHHGVWRDVVLLERRSTVIGQDESV